MALAWAIKSGSLPAGVPQLCPDVHVRVHCHFTKVPADSEKVIVPRYFCEFIPNNLVNRKSLKALDLSIHRTLPEFCTHKVPMYLPCTLLNAETSLILPLPRLHRAPGATIRNFSNRGFLIRTFVCAPTVRLNRVVEQDGLTVSGSPLLPPASTWCA